MNDPMQNIRFEDISDQNLPSLQKLLFDRNRTLASYADWKYGVQSPERYKGVIAFFGEEPVGCFGLVSKKIRLNGEEVSCGWFADWYVKTNMRAHGLGRSLLRIIMDSSYDVLFGHPGPKQASAICLQQGWKPILFQSSLRYILSLEPYFRKRSHNMVRKWIHILNHQIRSFRSKILTINHSANTRSEASNSFINLNSNWLYQQPVHPTVDRKYGTWNNECTYINYCDDRFVNGERRRRVLTFEYAPIEPAHIRKFFSDSKKSGISYIEAFTTDMRSDWAFRVAGAVLFHESPVLWFSKVYEIENIMIQGIDRENWLYLAGEK